MGNLWSYFMNSLGYGLEDMNVVLLGIPNAGKSCLAHVLKTGEYKELPPTVGIDESPNVEIQDPTTPKTRKSLRILDISGDDQMKDEWQMEAQNADLVLFLVDGTEPNAVRESVHELDQLLDTLPSEQPVLILMTKYDLALQDDTKRFCRFGEFSSLLKSSRPLTGMDFSSKTKYNLKPFVEKLVLYCKEAKKR